MSTPEEKEYQRLYRIANRERIAESKRQWKLDNPDKVSAAKKRWNASDKAKEGTKKYLIEQADILREKRRVYYLANSDKIKKRASDWFASANKDKLNERNRIWCANNPASRKASCDKWRKKNPGSTVAAVNRRRALKKNSSGEFSSAEFSALCNHYGNVCLRCWRSAGLAKLTADHVVPLIKGGSNDISNIQPLCKSCNSSKGTKSTDYRVDTLKNVQSPQEKTS